MKKRSKTIIGIIMCSMLLFGCSGTGKGNENTKDSQSVSIQDGEEGSVAETMANELDFKAAESILTEANWSGVDALGKKYLLNLSGDKYIYSVVEPTGDESTRIEGTYSFDADGISFYDAKDIEKKLSEINCSFALGGKEPFIKINDVYLSKSDIQDLSKQIQEMDIAAMAAEYLSTGHCWITCMDNKAIVFCFDGNKIEMSILTKDGDKVVKESASYSWCINQNVFALFDATGIQVNDYEWEMDDEGELKVFSVHNAEDDNTFYEMECDSIDSGEEMAEIYLENQKNADEVDDISTILNGYEGVSIVDAFVMVGLDPRIENRAIFAEKIGIENYRGTAEQNIFLLKSMGGTVK